MCAMTAKYSLLPATEATAIVPYSGPPHLCTAIEKGAETPAAPVPPPRPPASTLPSGQTHGRLLAGLLPWLARGGELYCLDAGNVFDPYMLVRLATQAGLAPGVVLDRIFVSRTYTCHQLLEAVETMVAPLAARRPAPLVLVLQVDRLFHDEDVALRERQYLFGRIAAGLARLHGAGLPLLLTLGPERPNPWAGQLAQVARLTSDVRTSLTALTE